MIIQVPRGGEVHRQLSERLPASLERSDVVIEAAPADDEGNLEAEDAGEVVLSVPAPQALSRDPEEVHRVLAQAGTGTAPLVVVIEAAEELDDESLAPLMDAVARAPRPVILRVVRNG